MDHPEASKCCRCCLTTTVELHSLHSVCDSSDNGADTYMDRFHWCTMLDDSSFAAEEDNDKYRSSAQLPSAICSSCLQDLRVAYDFRQRCVLSHRILRDRGPSSGGVEKLVPSASATAVANSEQTPVVEEIIGVESGDWSTADGDDDNDDENIMIEEQLDDDELVEEETASIMEWIIETVDETTDGLPQQEEPFLHDAVSVDDAVTVDPFIDQDSTDDAQQLQQLNEKSFEISFACQSCEVHLASAALLLEHQLICGENVVIAHKLEDDFDVAEEITEFQAGGFSCDYCGKVTTTKSGMVKHMQAEHVATKSRDFLCPTCGKGFRTAQRLRVHNYIHTGERPHSCDHCPMRFATEFRLRAHRRVHTGERPFRCTVCAQRFAQTNALKCHMRVHTGERPYSCPVCGKSFTQNTILKTHMALHLGKTVQCPDCDKKFARVSYLILHRREHTGEKPYACDRCPNRYKQQSHLSRHMDTHNGIRYPCSVCNKEYTKQWSLKIHMYTHSGMRPFGCTLCDASYVRRDKYRAHMLRKHAIEVDAEEETAEMFQRQKAEEICGL